MKYAYNETGKLINGVIFFFEAGDEQLATHALAVIGRSTQSPTSIVWGGLSLTRPQALELRKNIASSLEQGMLGIRFTIESESDLLGQYLNSLERRVPQLTNLTQEIKRETLARANALQ